MARVSRKGTAPETARPDAVHVYEAAAYVRLSDEDIRKKLSDSIGTQKALLTDFIQARPDLRLHDIYEDVNYTGTNFKRPAFARMIEDIQAGKVDCVLVKDLSRFGRSFEEMGHYLERVFPFLQVRFISVNDGYDSLTSPLDESSLIVPLKNLMNEVYARDISRKVKSSVKMRQRRGEFCGSIAPYGYIKEGAAFAVDAEAATVVRRIFEWVLEGFSDVAIAQKLNDLKIPPPSRYRFEKGITKAKKHKETRFWYKSAVKRISENPAYTGILASPVIIDSGVFEAVREIREGRRPNYKACEDHVPHDNILKGLIFCGDCKAHMKRERVCRANGNAEYYFVCNVHAQVSKNACTRKKIMEDDIQAALFAYIRWEISLAVDMGRIFTDIRNRASFQGQSCTLEKKTTSIQKKLAQNRRYRGSLRENYLDGLLSKQDYASMKADYNEEKDRLALELDALLAEKQRQNNTLLPESKWTDEYSRFETEERLSAQMISALVERIEVFDGGRIEVSLRFRDEFRALREFVNG